MEFPHAPATFRLAANAGDNDVIVTAPISANFARDFQSMVEPPSSLLPNQKFHKQTCNASRNRKHLRAATHGAKTIMLIRIEGAVIVLPQRPLLLMLDEVKIADGERVEICAHEAAVRIFRRTHDWLVANVKASVDQDWATGLRLEGR